MIEDIVLYLANDDTERIDALNGVLMAPPDDHAFQAMAEQHGYERIDRDDERYSGCLMAAYDALHNEFQTKENQP